MLKQIFLVLWAVIWIPLFAHEEYSKMCKQQDRLRDEIVRHKKSQENLWEKIKNEPLVSFKSLDQKIKNCEKEIERLERSKREIENAHTIWVKYIKLSNIPDVDPFLHHADLRIYHNKQLLLSQNNCDNCAEFQTNLIIKREDVLSVKDEDTIGEDDIGHIPLRPIIQKILRGGETKGKILVEIPSQNQGQSPCKIEFFYEVKSRNK